MTARRLLSSLLCLSAIPAFLPAQTTTTLARAKEIALRNHPSIASAAFTAQAGAAVVKEAHAAFLPTVAANLTAVGSEHDSTLTSGAVTTSSIYSRSGTGVVASQLLTDFGRTARLEQSARRRSAALNQSVDATRAQVLLEVEDAYYQALAGESVLKVARANLDLRRLTLRQVSALARSGLRSTLDVSFAEVSVSEAELDLARAEDEARASHARLSASLGYERDEPFGLVDEPLPQAPVRDVESLVSQALRERPDLAAAQLNRDALESFAESEKRLRNPSVAASFVAGGSPARDDRLRPTYGGAGLNVNIPIFNGGLFAARRSEAEFRVASASKDAEALSIRIARDVRVAWLRTNDAYRRLDVTARLAAQASESLRLAQARYDSGLGSIVELNQAQLSQTTAQIVQASAKYEYLSREAALSYAMGILR